MLHRRDFLRTAAVSAGATTWFLPAFAISQDKPPAPSEKIRIGMIGVGGQGRSNMGAHMKSIVALCDVDSSHLALAKTALGNSTKADTAGILCVEDYRKLLDSKEIDAVVISTPDHWHAKIAVDACRAGKDVYCEKPLTLTIAEGRTMVEAARKYERVVQCGSQQRSDDKFRLACELVRSGRIGTIKTVRVGIPGVNFKGPAVADAAPPKELNYPLWLGPAPERPYNEKRVHYLFRFFWDYSGGQMTNFGAHHLDIAQWGLGMDASGPVKVEGKATYHKDKWFETPESCQVTWEYANGIRMVCSMAERGGTTFEGDKGTIYVTRGQIEASSPEILKEALTATDTHLYVSKNHAADWLSCVRSRKRPICDVEIGHRSATVCHLGNIASRLGRAIRWNPETETMVDDKEASAMVSRPYRAPWKLEV